MLFEVRKSFQLSAAHKLSLPYESPCANLHGHNWSVEVVCRAERLNPSGMVLDFREIKDRVQSALDHKALNDVLDTNPTAENIAAYVATIVGETCVEVRVEESAGSAAIWRR